MRDFTTSHPDFGVLDPGGFGHVALGIARTLDLDGRPVYAGGGWSVTSQFYDKDGNPIAPYGDPGLVGGHFDVDVYDEAPSTREIYHERQFDDKYDVTYVDIANDTRLLFEDVVGSAYPNDLRVVFVNPHNGGGGAFVFEAGNQLITGYTASGFETIFSPAELLQFRIDFISLANMRQTKPGTSQDDAAGRDGALSVQMYDTVSGDLVYELAVYNHFKKKKGGGSGGPPPIVPKTGDDACGVPFDDTVGSYGVLASGAVTDSVSYGKWYRDVPGTNLSKRHDIELIRNQSGIYEYSTASFFPVDGELYGNEGQAHNDLFTYSIQAEFTYNACADLFFEFEGNDDAWVFINGELVIELGGISTPSKQFVALDRLGLTDGEVFTLDFFFAKRHPTPDSLFIMRTNMVLDQRVITLPMSSALHD